MAQIISKDAFEGLFLHLREKGYDIIGPTVRDAAIVYDYIHSARDLPVGWGEEQGAGTYRLKKRGDSAYFGYAVGPTSWKKFLFPPSLKLWEAKREGESFKVTAPAVEKRPTVFLGVRPCELQAVGIQDKVFLGGFQTDSHYQSRRAHALIVAVNCTAPGGTCFCASMNTGPKAVKGFDLCLTEIVDEKEHYFLVEAATSRGREMMAGIPHQSAGAEHLEKQVQLMEQARSRMGRQMNTSGIKQLLYENPEHPRWEKIAERCLACANCTLVCPTCFCSTVEDTTDLQGDHAERRRRWDSCFNAGFSYIHGGSVRKSIKGRYRQWMTHKLASWYDQFGSSGCVGCGRCISWCPVGIDITQEVKMIREG